MTMAELLQSANGAERLADALLQSHGGVVLLRVPAPATAGDDAEQLGLATPRFNDVPLAPVVWRRVGDDTQLLVSATAVRSIVGTLSAASAEALFTDAACVVCDDVLFAITAFGASETQGQPFCYRLTLRAPRAN